MSENDALSTAFTHLTEVGSHYHCEVVGLLFIAFFLSQTLLTVFIFIRVFIVGFLTWKWSSVALPPMLRTFRELARFMLQPGQWTCKDKLIRMAENYSSKNTIQQRAMHSEGSGSNAPKLIWGTAFKVTTTEIQICLYSLLITYKTPQNYKLLRA